MSGLILKDILSMKKKMKLAFIIMLLYITIAITTKEISFIILVLTIFGAVLPVSSISFDETVNWEKLALSMPIEKKDIVCSKYAVGFGMSILALIVGFLVEGFISGGVSVEILKNYMYAACIILVANGLLFPFSFWLGAEKGRILLFVLMLAPMLLGVFMEQITGNKLDVDRVVEWITGVQWMLPIVIIIFYLLSLCVSVFLYKRREIM